MKITKYLKPQYKFKFFLNPASGLMHMDGPCEFSTQSLL